MEEETEEDKEDKEERMSDGVRRRDRARRDRVRRREWDALAVAHVGETHTASTPA